MIKIILDKETIEVEKVDDLTTAQLGKIFPADVREDVMVTFVVTTQPTSRRFVESTTP